MMRVGVLAAAASVLCALAGCSEKPQSLGTGKLDVAPFQGSENSAMPYAVSGWKQGDKVSWEQQLKTRTQQGQNDHAKAN